MNEASAITQSQARGIMEKSHETQIKDLRHTEAKRLYWLALWQALWQDRMAYSATKDGFQLYVHKGTN